MNQEMKSAKAIKITIVVLSLLVLIPNLIPLLKVLIYLIFGANINKRLLEYIN